MGKKRKKKDHPQFAQGAASESTGKLPAGQKDEIAGWLTDIFATFIGNIPNNPDYILQYEASGKSYKLYDEMVDKDLHLFAALNQRKLGVLSKPWQILAGSEEGRDQEIHEFVVGVFENIKYFDRDLSELLEAVAKGFAISEVMWGIRDGRIVIDDIRNRDQRRFVFDTANKPRLRTRSAWNSGIELPDRKFLVHTYAPRYESPYGEAVLKKCYWYWWFKKNGLRFWMIFAEKFGSPTTVGKYPPGTAKALQDDLLDILKKIQQETSVIVPENLAIELLEANRKTSTDTYQGLCDYFDSQISQAVLGQTLTSSEGQHGTQALGKVHQGVRQDYIEADCNSLGPVINELIEWVVDWNFSGVKYYPYFKIYYEEPGDLVALAQRDKTLFRELGLPIARRYLYEAYSLPEPEEGEELLEVPQTPSPFDDLVEQVKQEEKGKVAGQKRDEEEDDDDEDEKAAA